ncbi:MAG: hypothetical protein ACD_51C00141G0001 [uncultured bacterium]|nr:MAG: hypothetical protein ACD_51C00141G0001 [uncultured bacterium]
MDGKKYAKKLILYIGAGLLILIIGFVLVGFLVFEPQNIRSGCDQEAREFVLRMAKGDSFYNRGDRDADYKFKYQSCLRENGFENL